MSLPSLPDDTIPDIIINPHTFPPRMSLGDLTKAMMDKLLPTPAERERLRAERPARRAARRQAKQEHLAARNRRVVQLSATKAQVVTYIEAPMTITNELVTTTVKRHNQGLRLVQEINQPSTKYLDWFWRHHREFLDPERAYKLFPDAKEITESVAAYQQLVQLEAIGDLVLVVSDGATPRTGSLFVTNDRIVYSIDPLMRPAYCTNIQQPQGVASTIEDWLALPFTQLVLQQVQHRLTIVAVHSHAVLSQYLPLILPHLPPNVKLSIYSNDCCVHQSLPAGLDIPLITNEVDWGIWSPKRSVKVWHQA